MKACYTRGMGGVKTIVRWLVVAVLVVLAGNIAASNSHGVTIHFWPFGAVLTTPVWFVLLGGVSLGLLLGGAMFWWRLLWVEFGNRRLRRHLRDLKDKTPTPSALIAERKDGHD